MSVLIKGMKMPASCYDCDLCSESMDSERNVYWTCPVLNMDVEKYERREDCTLVELPKVHGRLIDADALEHIIAQFSLNWEYGQGVSDCWDALLAAPTIIEAEGDEV